MNPLISIIIPAYNHADALSKALTSIEKQTYKHIEVIVVDDGSEVEAKSQKPIARLPARFAARRARQAKSSLMIVWLRQEHMGASAARNRGFEASSGQYVIFWDADVIAVPEMLQKMVMALSEHPEASYAYSDYHFGFKKMPAGSFDPERLKRMNFIMTTSLMSRDAFPEFDESLKRFQDWDLWLTMLERGKIGVWIPEYLFRVIPHRGGISAWLPSFAYRRPWRLLPWIREKVDVYEKTRNLVLHKHRLPG